MNYTFRDLCVGFFADRTLDTDAMVDGIHAMLAMYARPVTDASHNLLSSHDVERFLHMADGRVDSLWPGDVLPADLPGRPRHLLRRRGRPRRRQGPRQPGRLPVGSGRGWPRATRRDPRALTALRREYPALRLGVFREVDRFEEGFAFTREHEGQRILVVINNGAAELEYELPESASVLYGAVPLPPMSGLIAKLAD